MNPLTNTRNINELNAREPQLNIPEHESWHAQYSQSAWIFIGGLPFELTEGDVVCIFSQCGEPVNIDFIRDKKKGKFKGYCFLCYEDQRITALAVDNFNGMKVCGWTIRVDHVADYKPPKEGTGDEIAKIRAEKGCGPDVAKDFEKKLPCRRKIRQRNALSEFGMDEHALGGIDRTEIVAIRMREDTRDRDRSLIVRSRRDDDSRK